MSDLERKQQLSSEIIAIQQLIEFYWNIPVMNRRGDYGELLGVLTEKANRLRNDYFKLIPNP